MADNGQVFYNRPAFPAQLDMAHPLTKGLVGCWLLNEDAPNSLRTWDSSLYQNHGLSEGVGVKSSWAGKSLTASPDLIDCGNAGILQQYSEISIFAWCKPNIVTNAEREIVTKVIEWSGGWALLQDSVDGTKLAIYAVLAVGGLKSALSDSGLLKANQWFFTGFTFSPIALTLYVDGKEIKKTTFAADTIATTTKNFCIGGRDNPITDIWAGTIAGVWYYKRTVSPDEVLQLYLHPYDMFIR